MNRQHFSSALLVAFLAGCTSSPTTQTTETVRVQVTTCGNLQFVQNGQTVSTNGSSVSLLRSPFLISFVGQGSSPTFHASPQATLAITLKRLGQPEVWNMAGNGLASDDDEMLTRRNFAIVGDEKLRTQYASHLGANYPDILRAAIASHPSLTLLAEVPQNSFRYFNSANGQPIAKVAKVDGEDIANTKMQSIFIVSFAIQEKVAPLLYRTSWDTCEVRFTPK